MRVWRCDALANIVPSLTGKKCCQDLSKPNQLTERCLKRVRLHHLSSSSNTGHLKMCVEHRRHRSQRQASFKHKWVCLCAPNWTYSQSLTLNKASARLKRSCSHVCHLHKCPLYTFDVWFHPSFSVLLEPERPSESHSCAVMHFIKYNYRKLLMVNIN